MQIFTSINQQTLKLSAFFELFILLTTENTPAIISIVICREINLQLFYFAILSITFKSDEHVWTCFWCEYDVNRVISFDLAFGYRCNVEHQSYILSQAAPCKLDVPNDVSNSLEQVWRDLNYFELLHEPKWNDIYFH